MTTFIYFHLRTLQVSERIYSIDSLRAIAIFFVVIAHLRPFEGFPPHGALLYFVLDTIGQFDVPFFFLTAGYFLATKLQPADIISSVCAAARKLGSLYIFGILVHLTAMGVVVTVELLRNRAIMTTPAGRLLKGFTLAELVYYGNGIAVPLWFLTTLFFSICLVALFVALRRTRYLLPVAAGIHLLGILAQNYPMVLPITISFPTRDALFFGFFYVALGYWVRRSDWTPDERHSPLYFGSVCVFVALQVLEQYTVSYLLPGLTFAQGIRGTEYTFATIVLAFSLFAYALSNPTWGKSTVLPTLGEYAVGVYLLHFPVYHILKTINSFVVPLSGLNYPATLAWQVLVTPLVYALSLSVYLLAARGGVVEVDGSHTPWIGSFRARLDEFTSEMNFLTN